MVHSASGGEGGGGGVVVDELDLRHGELDR